MRTQHFLRIALVGSLHLACVPELPAPVYVFVEGVDGDATAPGHENWIELISFNQGIQRPSASLPPTLEELVVEKMVDRSSPLLAQALCEGAVFPEVIVDLTRILTLTGGASLSHCHSTTRRSSGPTHQLTTRALLQRWSRAAAQQPCRWASWSSSPSVFSSNPLTDSPPVDESRESVGTFA
jgi:hypothetical protein